MKKKLLALAFASTLILGACAGEDTDTENNRNADENQEDVSEDRDNEENNNEGVEVDKKLVNVEITLPATLLELDENEEIDIDEMKEEAKENGIKDVELNDNNSVTYTMSKSTHRELLAEMEKEVEETIEETIDSEDFSSIKDIKANKNYDKYEVLVDKEAYENSFDGFGILGVAFTSMYYQLFEGVNPEDYEVIIELEDEESGEIFDTIVYPDALDEE